MAMMHCRVLGLRIERGRVGKQCESPFKVVLPASMGVESVANALLRLKGSNNERAKSRINFLTDSIAI